ncbi:hypothetical protein OMW55_04740 [Sphingomonas sp. BN140010]|uniref:DUF3617 family protein n=1 Tax=Sphingomonas arvum TaxID=2992113 RepID=A0ABT3JDG4_9SPHN|nr:DUF3617 family protein [Sphingomonas sp. BN140010]MCW3797113.1 hypothetical protein [Sphingomonas sp. BN140010]
MRHLLISLAALGSSAALAAPAVLPGVAPGLWEVSRSATGEKPVRQCVSDLAAMAQWEHRGGACTRVVLSQTATEAVIHYTCPAGDFGRTRMTVVTPRSLRMETQGIHAGEPFSYKLYARRTADC